MDTNVLVSAFISSGGHSHEILNHGIHQHQLYYTNYILSKFKEKFKTKFHFSKAVIDTFVEFIERFLIRGETAILVEKICRDPDDDHILADAVTNSVDIILTGDADLLVLKKHKGIRILPPKEYWFL